MKQIHHYTAGHYNRPSKLEWAAFALALAAAAALIGLLVLSGCSTGAGSGQTRAETKLDANETRQLSRAAAAVDAAKVANAANPEGLPRTATAGELSVADANLPRAEAVDAQVAQARVNAALAGKLAEVQRQWAAAVVQGEALTAKIALLEKQVIAERAAAEATRQRANERLCVLAALVVGGVLSLLATLSAAAGLYFSLTKLLYGAAGLGVGGVAAFFAATQVGTAHFNSLAMLVLAGGVTAMTYTLWHGFAGGNLLKTKAEGFDNAMKAIGKFAGEMAEGVEMDIKRLWHWLGQELDAAHKALVADWQKLDAKLNAKSPTKPSA